MKTHKFDLNVTSHGSRQEAETAILCSFAGRKPDGCEFHLNPKKPEEIHQEPLNEAYWQFPLRCGFAKLHIIADSPMGIVAADMDDLIEMAQLMKKQLERRDVLKCNPNPKPDEV